MVTKANAFLACMTLALVVGCGDKSSNVTVDTPKENSTETEPQAKTEELTTEKPQPPTAERAQPPAIDIWKAVLEGYVDSASAIAVS